MEFVGHKTTKIPTLLGLSLLFTALVLGVFIFFYRQNITNQQKKIFNPTGIQVVNLLDNQATIIWWTDESSVGQVVYGQGPLLDQTQGDNRDISEVKSHQVHFVTLRNLQPETTYKYQVVSGGYKFPEQPQTFKTVKTLDDLPQNRPLRGSVLNVNLNPIDEALVFVKINGAAEMATFTSTSGNFILPLKLLRTEDLSASFAINSNTPATLLIKKGLLQSQVDLNLPLEDNQLLPPLTLGQNINLKDIMAQNETLINPEASPAGTNYDLNNDGKTNSLDLALITQNTGKKVADVKDEQLKKADLNSDGVIDKKDADLLVSKL